MIMFVTCCQKFAVKRLFENSTHIILEIRITYVRREDASADCQWLYFEKKSEALIKLWLKSSDSSPVVEEQFFEQGYLKFNCQQATFIEKFNSAQYTLERKPSEQLTEQLGILIHNYLS